MMSLRSKYQLLRATTIALGALSIPLSTFVGFCFGDGRYSVGVVFLGVQTFLSLLDGFIWFWVLEHMDAKIKEEEQKIAKSAVEPVSRMHPELVSTGK
jgi:hypothetical protein